MGQENCSNVSPPESSAAHTRLDQVLARPPRQTISLPDPAALLKAKIQMAINRLMATYLSNLEEIADEHDEAMGKLIDVLPIEHKASVHLADHFSEARFDAVRKHVLKSGNDQSRDLFELVDFLRLPVAAANHP